MPEIKSISTAAVMRMAILAFVPALFDVFRDLFILLVYFPMQKREKIDPRISSVVISPVIFPIK